VKMMGLCRFLHLMWLPASRREQGKSVALLHGYGSRNLLLEVDLEDIVGLLEELQLEIE
jgi:hypothetical protein